MAKSRSEYLDYGEQLGSRQHDDREALSSCIGDHVAAWTPADSLEQR